MKKIAKLSLVAAVAVAGLTTANAQQLEDAIKKVEVSGSVVYRYNDYIVILTMLLKVQMLKLVQVELKMV